VQKLEASVRWYLRSIELCDNYLRGYYGLRLVTSNLLAPKYRSVVSGNSGPRLAEDTISKLSSVAAVHLQDIIRGFGSGKKGFTGYDPAEIQAARELLQGEGVTVG